MKPQKHQRHPLLTASCIKTIKTPQIFAFICKDKRLRLSRGSVLAFSTRVRGFKRGRSRRIFRAKKILKTPSFGGEVKPSVPRHRFAARKRSISLRGSQNLVRCGRTGTWRRKRECLKAGESNGKLPPRTCPGCSVPEPYQSHDWPLVTASLASKAEY